MATEPKTPTIQTIVDELLAFTDVTQVDLAKAADCAQSTIVGIRQGADPRYSSGRALERLWASPEHQARIKKGRAAIDRIMQKARRVDCPECGEAVAVTTRGRIRQHRRPGIPGPLSYCAGSSQPA